MDPARILQYQLRENLVKNLNKFWIESCIKPRPTTALSSLNRIFSRNCTQYIVLFWELCPHSSSFSRTISSQQFFFENCVHRTVLFGELFPQNSSFWRTVSTEQFFLENCVHRTVLFGELFPQNTSFPETVHRTVFFQCMDLI